MTENQINDINEFRKKVSVANKEAIKKELFKDLLNRLYAGNDETKAAIDQITGGAERAILNIPRKNKVHRGSADTLYDKIIIEFENNLKVSLKHAKEQLAGYMLGQFNSGEGYNFTLIASDFINWRVFALDISCVDKLETLQEDTVILNEVTTSSFVLTEHNAVDFYYWIDRFLFKQESVKATLRRVEESFGSQSPVFIEALREMTAHFATVKDTGELQVSFEQWKKFLSVAYGSFDASEKSFLIHTYLSVFAKMLAYSVVSNDDFIDDDEMRGIVDGSIFDRFNIGNFVDDDFYHWIKSDASFTSLKKVFRLIAQELSGFDFSDVDEDVLKGVYQELIDLDTRHALGEYYTPDWLCERIVNEFDFKPTDKILDPSCGSGSFLRAAIARLKALSPTASVEQLNSQIYGIDIHPLSVQIAKTTILLAFGKEIINAKQPVRLNVLLANTLLIPKGVGDMFGGEFTMEIDKARLSLTTAILDDIELFDNGITVCDELAAQTLHQPELPANVIAKNLKLTANDATISTIEGFHSIYRGFKAAKETGRDSIWKFIVQNLYKPYFLAGKFDYVIGNPPWFTFSSVRNEEYQNTLDKLAKAYNVKPKKAANFPHLEIAAIFMAYCSSYFLKTNGKLAFVLPRSFFSADHHDNTRSGKADGFGLTQIWDLKSVAPLFRVPTCVLFAEKKFAQSPLPETGLRGKSFAGALTSHNQKLETAEPLLTETDTTWFYRTQGNSTAFSNSRNAEQAANPYKKLFKQGATIVPRTFYFVELNQETPPDFEDRIINVKSTVLAEAKKPWSNFRLQDRIESNFLFRTALSKSILPFALYKPNFVVLPATIETKPNGQKRIKLHSADELLENGFLHAAKWFRQVETIWNDNKTDKNQSISAKNYLNWQNKITEQNLNAPYLVLYNSSAKDANATIVKRENFDLEFVVDHKAYIYFTNDLNEAFYLTAILNSSAANESMKDFQSRGLFGARDVHKKILDVYYPRLDAAKTLHLELAALSETAHRKSSEFLTSNPPQTELSAMRLGRLRLDIKRHLTAELTAIDEIVRKIVF